MWSLPVRGGGTEMWKEQELGKGLPHRNQDEQLNANLRGRMIF